MDLLVLPLRDEDDGVRTELVSGLGRLHDPRPLGPLIDASASEPHRRSRERAAWALGELNAPRRRGWPATTT